MDKITQALARLTRNQKIGLAAGAAFLLFSGACCCPGVGWLAFSEVQARREAAQVAKAKKDLEDVFAAVFVQPVKPPSKQVVVTAEAKKKPEAVPLTPGQAAVIEGVKVELVSGRIGKLRMVSTSGLSKTEYDSAKEVVQLNLRISNQTETLVLEYASWLDGASTGRASRLRDEFDNEYRSYGGAGFSSHPKGGLQYRIARVDPGKAVDDVIAFDLPIAKAMTFTITLPGSNIRKPNEEIAYKIPRSWFGK